MRIFSRIFFGWLEPPLPSPSDILLFSLPQHTCTMGNVCTAYTQLCVHAQTTVYTESTNRPTKPSQSVVLPPPSHPTLSSGQLFAFIVQFTHMLHFYCTSSSQKVLTWNLCESMCTSNAPLKLVHFISIRNIELHVLRMHHQRVRRSQTKFQLAHFEMVTKTIATSCTLGQHSNKTSF